MPKTFYNYIEGRWVKSASGKTFKNLNPATGEVIGLMQAGNAKDVQAAVDAAERAFPRWSATPAPTRGRILYKVAELLRAQKEQLARAMTVEMGKVLAESRGDVQECIDIFEYMAGEGRRLFGITTPSELPEKTAYTLRRPVGVVGLITPWNFPLAIPGWKLAPALVCGNTVVLKPASDTPIMSIKLVEILEKAGVPRGVVNLVTGSGSEVGLPIIKHKKVLGLSFTGSREVGAQVLREAGIKKVGLELGGKNPIIIMPDANLDLALEGCVWGGFGTTGQRCTAASRVIVHKSVAEKFKKSFIARAKTLKLGSGLEKSTDVGPVINEQQLEKVHRYTGIGVSEGAKLACGGKRAALSGKWKKGFFYEPTVFTDVQPDMRVAREEIFGPTVSVIEVKNLDEAIEVANNVSFGLSSSIYTQNISDAMRAIEKLETGITYVNAPTIGAEVHLPFGGVKQTGNGTREAGITGIEEFSELKTVYIDYHGKLQKAQIDVKDQ